MSGSQEVFQRPLHSCGLCDPSSVAAAVLVEMWNISTMCRPSFGQAATHAASFHSVPGEIPRYLPEYVRVAKPVHELHLAQHVSFVASQRVHLQCHHLARDPMLHLEHKQRTSAV